MNPRHQMRPQQVPMQRPYSPVPVSDESPKPRRKQMRSAFRAEYVLLPLVILLVMWIIVGADGPGYSFDDWMSLMNVRDREQYRQLATFGVVVTTVVWVTKIVKSSNRRG
ncbi:MAG: hypothetical protein IPK83_16960 [Planctomycetes bacterium]|nr:hypothetical protein [Planctomycetota bacterium]